MPGLSGSIVLFMLGLNGNVTSFMLNFKKTNSYKYKEAGDLVPASLRVNLQ